LKCFFSPCILLPKQIKTKATSKTTKQTTKL